MSWKCENCEMGSHGTCGEACGCRSYECGPSSTYLGEIATLRASLAEVTRERDEAFSALNAATMQLQAALATARAERDEARAAQRCDTGETWEDECVRARRERDNLRMMLYAEDKQWEDTPLPEDEAISAAFPTRSGKHEAYGEAMRLVGARHSKGGLVALVNWLLVERDGAREALAAQVRVVVTTTRERDEAREALRAFDCTCPACRPPRSSERHLAQHGL